jgi:hypothetical protein
MKKRKGDVLMKPYKRSALKVIWNKDLSLSVYPAGGGKKLITVRMGWDDKSWLDAVSGFCEGWFGTDDRDQWRIRCKLF